MAPVLSSEMDLSPIHPVSLAQLGGVSVVLVNFSSTQGQEEMDEENKGDGEQPESRKRS